MTPMFRFVVFGLAVLLLAYSADAGRDEPPTTTTQFLKPCSKKNPPPCAKKPPVVVHSTDPEYSKEAQKAKVKGTVVLETVIGDDGLAYDIHVLRPLGYGCDERAVNALKTWNFRPAIGDDGKPVAAKIVIEMSFH